MKRLLLLLALAIALSCNVSAQEKRTAVQTAGIAFYNLENLFDTIPNNPEGRDAEYTPAGSKQWDGRKYRNKIDNLSYAISQFTTKTTPYGPAIIGVSEIENRSVLDDLVAAPAIRDWKLQVVHHDSPDARGVDVGLLYNPRYFRLENVTNLVLGHTIVSCRKIIHFVRNRKIKTFDFRRTAPFRPMLILHRRPTKDRDSLTFAIRIL